MLDHFIIILLRYNNYKSIFYIFQQKVFKKILEEVETKIMNIRTNLKSKLHQMPTTLKQQKKIIR